METVIQTCPHCTKKSRVPTDAIDQIVACPHCAETFIAVGEAETLFPDSPTLPPPVPVVRPSLNKPIVQAPVMPVQRNDGSDEDEHTHVTATGLLVALALLPMGIPLFWLAAKLLIGHDGVFSFAVPVTIALGITALGFGIVYAGQRQHPDHEPEVWPPDPNHNPDVIWSERTRIKAIVVIVLMAYLIATLLFFAKKEWLEAIRQTFNRGEVGWREYQPPDKTFQVKFPGPPQSSDSPFEDWKLEAVAFADNKADVFVVAYGKMVQDVPVWAADDPWFAKAKEALLSNTGAKVLKEETVSTQGYPGRQYLLELKDNTRNRVVRMIRVRDRLFYLAVESPFVTWEADDVKYFMESFYIPLKR